MRERRDSKPGFKKSNSSRKSSRPYDGERRPYTKRDDDKGERKTYPRRDDTEKRPYARRDDDKGERKSYPKREDADKRPYTRRDDDKGERKSYPRRDDADKRPFKKREGIGGERKSYPRRTEDRDSGSHRKKTYVSGNKSSFAENKREYLKKGLDRDKINFIDSKSNFNKDDKPAFTKRYDDTTPENHSSDEVKKPFIKKEYTPRNEVRKIDSSEEKPVRKNVRLTEEYLNKNRKREIKEESYHKKRKRYTDDDDKTEDLNPFKSSETLRLNKFIANAGIASRRQVDEYIANGDVTVNGKKVLEMGFRVSPSDEIHFRGKKVEYGSKVYILLNKPKDFITTKSDEMGRKNVMELIANATNETVYPVGRLDRNTTGLLLFTNDGELTQQLTHPSFGVKKLYHVSLNRALTPEDMSAIAQGVKLDDGIAQVDDIAYADAKDKGQIGIEIHIGKNRIVRRIFESLGYEVVKLDRVTYAGISKKDLPRGRWRYLSEKEVMQLKKLKEIR
jgi:23S rRNA pseudouridine2605 synthase